MKKDISYNLFIAMVIGFSACVHDPLVDPLEKQIDELQGKFDLISCNEDTVYFENDILPLFLASCAGASQCHVQNTSNKSVSVTFYNLLQTKLVAGQPENSKLYTYLISDDEDKKMPRDYDSDLPYDLDPDKINKIKTWVEQGALLNGCDQCEIENVTFDNRVNVIVMQNCATSAACHGKSSQQPEFTSYEGIKEVVDNGAFEQRVLIDGDMPKNGELTGCEIELLEKWLDNDAKEK